MQCNTNKKFRMREISQHSVILLCAYLKAVEFDATDILSLLGSVISFIFERRAIPVNNLVSLCVFSCILESPQEAKAINTVQHRLNHDMER